MPKYFSKKFMVCDDEGNVLPWIRVCSGAPYFEDDRGLNWTPIGQNDAISWPDFQDLFGRKNIEKVDGHMAYLAAHGVTCIRMMMEYCQTENRYLEKPVGRFQRNMIQFWDDLFVLCRKYRIRILITPFDTYWMARRWKYHPYNKISGGPCSSKWQWLTSPEMLEAIKVRFDFFIERWGSCGTIFAWDLWNEIDPLNAGRQPEQLVSFIDKISMHITDKELALFGKCHLQTVSAFAPTLRKYDFTNLIFKHPGLHFATTHFYGHVSIDYPRNTCQAALVTAKLVENSLSNCPPGRPFMDTEHGPISYYKKNRNGLPEEFDDIYFLYMQWAHVASGGVGGGMRWPYRHPHVLTYGMRKAQLNLSQFVKLIDWSNFRRENIHDRILTGSEDTLAFGCGDKNTAVVWVVRQEKKTYKKESMLNSPSSIALTVPGLDKGSYNVHLWNTKSGLIETRTVTRNLADLELDFMLSDTNMAIAVVSNSLLV